MKHIPHSNEAKKVIRTGHVPDTRKKFESDRTSDTGFEKDLQENEQENSLDAGKEVLSVEQMPFEETLVIPVFDTLPELVEKAYSQIKDATTDDAKDIVLKELLKEAALAAIKKFPEKGRLKDDELLVEAEEPINAEIEKLCAQPLVLDELRNMFKALQQDREKNIVSKIVNSKAYSAVVWTCGAISVGISVLTIATCGLAYAFGPSLVKAASPYIDLIMSGRGGWRWTANYVKAITEWRSLDRVGHALLAVRKMLDEDLPIIGKPIDVLKAAGIVFIGSGGAKLITNYVSKDSGKEATTKEDISKKIAGALQVAVKFKASTIDVGGINSILKSDSSTKVESLVKLLGKFPQTVDVLKLFEVISKDERYCKGGDLTPEGEKLNGAIGLELLNKVQFSEGEKTQTMKEVILGVAKGFIKDVGTTLTAGNLSTAIFAWTALTAVPSHLYGWDDKRMDLVKNTLSPSFLPALNGVVLCVGLACAVGKAAIAFGNALHQRKAKDQKRVFDVLVARMSSAVDIDARVDVAKMLMDIGSKNLPGFDTKIIAKEVLNAALVGVKDEGMQTKIKSSLTDHQAKLHGKLTWTQKVVRRVGYHGSTPDLKGT